jgi:hypothetical protein
MDETLREMFRRSSLLAVQAALADLVLPPEIPRRPRIDADRLRVRQSPRVGHRHGTLMRRSRYARA